MGLPLYLAMTAAEMRNCQALPKQTAWMACHFSPYGSGISNVPQALPEGSMLILNDRVPLQGHNPALVAAQLAEVAGELGAERVLLDFQRPLTPEAAAVITAVVEALPCPVAVTPPYGEDLGCALFLTPKIHKPLRATLEQFPGREVWLEAATECVTVTVTAEGSVFCPAEIPEEAPVIHVDEGIHCRYCTEVSPERVVFTLWRDEEQLTALLEEAERLGVTCAVGLYQQLGK